MRTGGRSGRVIAALLLVVAGCGEPPTLPPAGGGPAVGIPTPRQPGFGDPPVPGAYPAVEQTIPTFELEIAPADLATLEANPLSDAMVPATVTLAGVTAPAHVRYRGASARTVPQKSFRVDLDPGYEIQGRDTFALIAEWEDTGKLTERFASDLFRALDLPASRARYVKVVLNGKPYGVHVDMERVVKEYLELHGFDPGASIYRCGGRNCEMKLPRAGSYQQDFTKTKNETAPWGDLDALLRVINFTDDEVFLRELEARLELDGYIGNLAVDALISNFLVEDSRSYWIHEGVPDRWRYAPWDLNNAMSIFPRGTSLSDGVRGTTRDPRVFTLYDPTVETIYRTRLGERASQQPTWSVLATRLWDIPSTRGRIVDAIAAALDGPFSEARAGAHVDALWAAAGPAILDDPFIVRDAASDAPAYLERFVRERGAYLRSHLAELRAHGSGPLVVNELGFAGASPAFVELYNRGDAPIELGGLAITNDLRVPNLFRFPSGLSVPAHGWLQLVADGSTQPGHLPFAPSPSGGAMGIFRVGTVCNPLDAVYFGPHGAGRAYGRVPDGADAFREMAPTPGRAAAP